MVTKTLKLDISDGNWMVNIIHENLDNDKYELLHPNREASVEVTEQMQGFDYNIVASAGTPFKLLLDDIVLAEGQTGENGVARGKGVI